jgi:hypothetical protein
MSDGTAERAAVRSSPVRWAPAGAGAHLAISA